MWVHARQVDGGCVVHSENVAGQLWEEETEVLHAFVCTLALERPLIEYEEGDEWALKKKGVNKRLIRAVMQMYEGSSTKVKVGKKISDAFNVKVGVHQG